jgi:hypothetical protein
MKTIIINGQRELAELPELWYTDGTDEANEWGRALGSVWCRYKYVANRCKIGSNGDDRKDFFPSNGHAYITHSEFMRLVYEPWKESQKVKLPTTYEKVCDLLDFKSTLSYHHIPHINACIQLTNIMNFANDAFEGDGQLWQVWSDSIACVSPYSTRVHPIRFTSKAAAEWAYKTFPEIFKAYWNV